MFTPVLHQPVIPEQPGGAVRQTGYCLSLLHICLIRYFEGDCLALVNLSPTPMDQKAYLVIRGKIGEVLSRSQ